MDFENGLTVELVEFHVKKQKQEILHYTALNFAITTPLKLNPFAYVAKNFKVKIDEETRYDLSE